MSALCFGDVCFLALEGRDLEGPSTSFLVGDGFNSKDLSTRPQLASQLDFEDCHFRFCLVQSFKGTENGPHIASPRTPHNDALSPRDEVAEAQLGGGGGGGGGGDGDRATMRLAEPLQFGQVVQLQHVKSGKFLTASTSAVASRDQECMSLSLEQGSDHSQFQLVSKYRIQSEGAPVIDTNEVRLRNVTLGNYFVHASPGKASRHQLPHSDVTEVNLSLSGHDAESAWQVRLYCKASSEAERAQHVQLGQNVSFFHTQSACYMIGSSSVEKAKKQNIMRAKPENSVKAFFSFESQDPTLGGPVCWGERYYVKHMTSGKYLKQGASGASGQASFGLAERRDDAHVFSMEPTAVSEEAHTGPVSWASILRIGCNISCLVPSPLRKLPYPSPLALDDDYPDTVWWVHRLEVGDAEAVRPASGSLRKTGRIVGLSQVQHKYDAICLHEGKCVISVWQLSFVRSCVHAAERFVVGAFGHRAILKEEDDGVVAGAGHRVILDEFCGMLDRLISMLREFSGAVLVDAQSILADLEMIDALVWCCQVPILCICSDHEHDEKQLQVEQCEACFKHDLPTALEESQNKATDALVQIVKGNRHNQSYIARKTFRT